MGGGGGARVGRGRLSAMPEINKIRSPEFVHTQEEQRGSRGSGDRLFQRAHMPPLSINISPHAIVFDQGRTGEEGRGEKREGRSHNYHLSAWRCIRMRIEERGEREGEEGLGGKNS